MKRIPELYTPRAIRAWDTFEPYEVEPGHYAFNKPLRPLGYEVIGLFARIVLAWGVFTGKYDAIYWEEND